MHDVISLDDPHPSVANGHRPALDSEPAPRIVIPVGTTIAEAERQLILATLDRHGGNKRKAATVLGISVRTIYNRLRDYRRTATT